MFQPNSIRSLLSKKSYNQLEKNNSQTLSPTKTKDEQENNGEHQDLDYLRSKPCRDISEKIINTRVMLKEIDYKLQDLQKWKQERKKNLEDKLKQNKDLASTQYDAQQLASETQKEREEEEGYQKYIAKLNDVMNMYTNSLSKNLASNASSNREFTHVINNIDNKILEKENQLDELSMKLEQLENLKNIDSSAATQMESDLDELKEKLDSWKTEIGDQLSASRKNEIMSVYKYVPYDSKNQQETKNDNHEQLKAMLKQDKENQEKANTSAKKANYDDDLDDIDKELKELEDLLGK